MSVQKGEYYDPSLLPNIQQAASRIYSSMMMGDTIAIYGDFDVDGITASAVMYKGLTKLGANVIVYIPHRGDEGHGLNQLAISELISKDVKLIITVPLRIPRRWRSFRLPWYRRTLCYQLRLSIPGYLQCHRCLDQP